MSPPPSSSFALATFLTLFMTLLLTCVSVPVVNGQGTAAGLVQCAPAQVQVGGGSGPYTVSVLRAGADGQLATGAEPLQTFPALNQSGIASWLVNVPSGTTVRLGVTDGTGAVSYSDPFTVQSGASSDCLPVSSASSATPTSSATPSSSALSSSSSSSASSQPESSASGSLTTTTTGSSTSGSVLSSSSSFLPASSLTGSVTTQLSSSVASLSTTMTTRPSISSSSSSMRTSSSSSRSATSSASAIDPSATNQLSSEASSLRPHAIQLTTWLSAALLIFICA